MTPTAQVLPTNLTFTQVKRTSMKDAYPTQLSELITAKMEEKGLSINELKVALDVTYEHARHIVRGEGIPSKHVLRLLADTLEIPREHAIRLATADKLKKKYGDIPMELAGQDPSLEPLQREWKKLTEDQKATMIEMARSMVKRNRAIG